MLSYLRRIEVRSLSVRGRFPLLRLLQVLENPAYLLHLIKKNLIYKRDSTDYRPFYDPFTFLSGQQTLEELIKTGKSLARFSDGEFEQLVGAGEYPPDSNWCQRNSAALRRDILANLSCTHPKLLVAVDPPETFLAPRDAIRPITFHYNMWVDMRRLMWRYLTPSQPYGHSHLFVPANCPELDWQMLRAHFRRKILIIATGNTQRLQHIALGRATYFVECGTENAYERKEQIKAQIRACIASHSIAKEDLLVCASLGPTAGIIAMELLAEDICVWDTGHMFAYAMGALTPSASAA